MKEEIDAPVSTDASGTDLENARDQPSGEKPTAVDIYLVEWDGPNDPELPMNFPLWKKSLITCIFSTLTIWVTFSSSVFSAAAGITSKEFHVSVEVMTLGTSLTVLGFTVGPLVWGPMSELYGRLKPLYIGYAIFIIFQVPVAVAQNLETLMLARFFLGFFGTSALAIIPGALADFWGPVERAIAISLFSAATFVGPIFGPIIGGFIVDSSLGWRWTAWITMIPASFFGIIAFLTLPETYHPVLLQRRASRLRKETRIWAYHSRLDENTPTFGEILTKYLFRPIQMLFLEPILVCMTIYISLIYGILYLFFVAYPIAFREVRNWKSLGIAALPFLGILVGVLMGCLLVTIATRLWYAPKLQNGSVVPEDRLPPMIVAAILLPIGLFWFGWTSSPSISWAPQAIAGAPIGMGILMIWMQGLNYLIDVYLVVANSAMSANTLIRSAVGAAFPLFATAMYHKLGVDWATSLLGFLSIAMIPIPVIFYFYGAKIRALSRFSPKW
ncbi:Citrinin biosynthesis cluster MFS transporter mrr1 [Monascus purpureus]|uniref:Citrinin biosynthesis cluster MFS transporter mrr1 n=2 Tax=Monascus TaxID=5097 RepID=MRR1_MONRU|nr:RecName: Full=Citrinin biosynthesis cluster MFS transporter mrr1 [Monascus ruber]ALI92656.1 MRR1 Major Facilitator Superfamily (MFS) protein [Monascus ruber]TQB68352.1 Citrinin biosynthesis cluster MFS transporter mrr1 [Monascus purpureus]